MKRGAITTITTECLRGLLGWETDLIIERVIELPDNVWQKSVTIITDKYAARQTTLSAIQDALDLTADVVLVAALQTPDDVLADTVSLLLRSKYLPEIPEGSCAEIHNIANIRIIIDENKRQ